MVLSAELELTVLIVALYVQDAMLLLHSNEGVLTSAGKGTWRLGLGFTQTRIAGKNLFVPNLLAPHRPHYRLGWDFETPAVNKPKLGTAIPNWSPQPQAFKVLGGFTCLSGVLQLLVFPCVMFLYPTDLSVLAALAAIYTTLVAALVWVGVKATTFGLAGKKLAALCFECLVCPPFAINLVRRLSLDRCKSADLVGAAHTLLKPEAWATAQQQLGARIEDQMSLEPEGSARYAALQSRLESLLPKRRMPDEH